MVELSIIILNWNSADFILDAINSIKKSTKQVSYEIIIVDNASYDKCKSILAEIYPEIIFIQSESNLGFAKGNNLGAIYSSGKLLLFLNPDTIIKGNAIDDLVRKKEMLDKPGVVGCCLLNTDGSKQLSCVRAFPTLMNEGLDAEVLMKFIPRSKLWGIAPLLLKRDVDTCVDAVSGACMLIDKSVFNLVGGFSEIYFMYSEDIDLCIKTHNEGYINYYVSAPKVIHFGGGSTENTKANHFSDIMITESRYRLFRKFRGEWYADLYRLLVLFTGTLRILILLLFLAVAGVQKKRKNYKISKDKWENKLMWALGKEKWVINYPDQ